MIDLDYEEGEPPLAETVSQRALALSAVTFRAMLEREGADTRNKAIFQKLIDWIRDLGIDEDFEEAERKLIQTPLGSLDERETLNSAWRIEGLVVLAWALGRFEIPKPDELVDPNAVWRSLGMLDSAAAKALLSNPVIRSKQDINDLREQMFAVHWRLRNYSLTATKMDFAEFAETCWFGPLNISTMSLIEGDMALGGVRIDCVTKEVFSSAHSASQERHQAANWLCEGPKCYSEASLDT